MAQNSTSRSSRNRTRMSVRLQLIGVTIIVALIPLLIISLINLSTTQNSLNEEVVNQFDLVTAREAESIAQLVETQVDLLRLLASEPALVQAVEDSNELGERTEAEIAAELQTLQAEWRTAFTSGTRIPLQEEVLASDVSQALVEFSTSFPVHGELIIANRYGRNLGATNLTSNYEFRESTDWFSPTLNNGSGATWIADRIAFDESLGADALSIAVPIMSDERAVGVLTTRYLVDGIFTALDNLQLGETGHAILLTQNGELVANSTRALEYDFTFDASTILNSQVNDLARIQTTQGETFLYASESISSGGRITALDELGWQAVFLQAESEAFAPVAAARNAIVLPAVLLFFIVTAISVYFASRVTQPLVILQQAAERIGRDRRYDTRVNLDRADEFGALADAFDTMAEELQTAFADLESRVEARTADLAASADIATAANEVRELSDLTSLAVNLIRDRFDFYYTQIYIVDPTQQYAVLADGTGYVGRRLQANNHMLALDERSLVSTAIKENRAVIVQDTATDPNHKVNELLPDTRSELVVPLRARDRVVGVIDIQHDEANVFDDSARRLFQTLADQLAVTFENTQLLQRAEDRAREMATVAQVSIEASGNLEVRQLLRTVSKLTRDNFGLYHTQIFLLNEAAQRLDMAAGAGEAGLLMMEQGHFINLNSEHSLVARAARTMETVTANNVMEEPDFLPNQMLPETQSEMAVPMIVGSQLIGVLDVQASTINSFDSDDEQVLNTLASQVAVAVQNARAFQSIEMARRDIEEERIRLRAVTQNYPNGAILMFDHNYRYLLVDGAGLADAGLNKETMEGRTVDEVYEAEMARTIKASYARALQGEESVDEVQYGKLVYRSFSLPMRAADGTILGGMTITQNITEEKERERLRQLELEISNKLNAASEAEDVLYALESYATSVGANGMELMYLEFDESGNPFSFTTVANWGGSAMPVGTTYYIDEFGGAASWLEDASAPTLYANIESDKTLEDSSKAQFLAYDARAAAILPMNLQGEWLALWMITWPEPHTFTQLDNRVFGTAIFQGTPVIGSIRNIEQIRRRVAELTAVADVSTAAASVLNTDALAKTVSDLAKSRFDLYHAHVYLLNEKGTALNLVAGSGDIGDAMVKNRHRIKLSAPHSLVAQAAREKQAVIANNVVSNPSFLPNPLLPATKSELAVPMLAAGRLIGVFDAQAEQFNRFTQEDVVVQSTLANQIAVAIENVRLIEDVQKRVVEMEAVTHVSSETASKLDIDDLLWSVVDLTQESFGRYHAHIYLYEPENDVLRLAAGSGERGRDMVAHGHIISMNSDGVVARTARERVGIAVNDVLEIESYLPNPRLPDTRSEIAVPILYGDELIGVLDVQDDQPYVFNDDSVQVKQTLANQIAVAIKNAEQFQLTEQRLREVIANIRIMEALRQVKEPDALIEDVLNIVLDTMNPNTIVWTDYDAQADEWIGRYGTGQGVNTEMVSTWRFDGPTIPQGLDALEGNQVVAVNNLTEYLVERLDAAPEYVEEIGAGIKSVMVIPIYVNKRGRGVIYLNYDQQYQTFNEEDKRLARSISNQLSLAIERLEAERQAQAAAAERERIFNSSIDLMGSATFEGYFTVLNDSWSRVLGWTDEELMAKPFMDFVHPDDVEATAREAAKIADGAETLQFENRYQTKDGSYRWIAWNSTPDLENQLIHFVARDVTEAKRIQNERERIFNIMEALRGSGDIEEKLETVFEIVLEALSPDNIVMMNYDNRAEKFVGYIGVGEGINTEIARTLEEPAEGAPHGMEALHTQTVVGVDDALTYPGFPLHYTAEDSIGIKSVLAVPIIVNQEARAVAFLNYNSAKRTFTDDDKRLAQSISNQLSQAIERLEAERQAQVAAAERERIFNSSIDLMGSATFEGYFTVLNESWSRVLGWTDEELMAKPFMDFVHPDDVEATAREAAKIADGAETLQFENRYQTKDGSYRWIAWNSTPDLENQLIHFVARDVTEAKRVQAEILRQSTLVETAIDYFGTASLDGITQYVNPAGIKMAGYESLTDVVGQPIAIFKTEEELQELEEVAIPYAMEEGAWVKEQHLKRADGTLISVEQQVFIVRDDDGEPTAIGTIMRDITARKQQQELQEILLTVSANLNAAMDPQDVLAAPFAYLRDRGVSAANLDYMQYRDDKPYSLRTVANWSRDDGVAAMPVGTEFTLADFAVTDLWMADPGSILLHEDLQTDERLDAITREAYERINARSAAVLPLFTRGVWAGVMVFYWRDKIEFNEQDIRVLSDVMLQSAPVVAALRSAQESEDARHRAEVVAHLNAELSRAETEIDIVNAMLTYVADLEPDEIQLGYEETNAQGDPVVHENVVIWHGGHIVPDHPALDKFDLTGHELARLWIENPETMLYIEDTTSDERLTPELREFMVNLMQVRTYLLIPLQSSGRWDGVFIMQWAEQKSLSPDALGILDTVRRTLASVVSSRRAYLATQQAQREADMLYQISARINEAEDEAQLLDALIQQTILPEATSIALGIFEGNDARKATYMHIVADWTETRPSLEGLAIPLEQLSYFMELDAEDVTMVNNIHEDESLSDDSRATLEALGVQALVMVPLRLAQRWLGALTFYADDPTQFDDQQRRVLRAIGRQFTAAIERFNLLRQTEKRAAELETVAQLSAATTTILDVDELLNSVVELTKTSFSLYHAHIYLLDESGENLVLAAGAGEPGRMMKERGRTIPVNHPNSLVARCARTRLGVIANDVHSEEGFLPNPLLPNTRSELAVPMIVGGELVGVLDTQSDEVNHFTENDVRMKTTLADQIAVAVQNAQAFTRERRAADYYREADRLKQEFLANMSHELRTPLNSIIGYSEVLLDGVDGDLTEDAVEDVEAIHNSGKHLLNIINEILDLAKIEAGQMQLHVKQMDLSEAIQTVVKSSQILVKEKPVTLEAIEDTPIPEVLGDHVRINQILLNLLSNAIKFTEEGDIHVRYGMIDETYIRVMVKDSGVGMTAEDLQVIFDRFRQVDGSSTRRAGGTGLGLTITRQLIEMHGGEIGVESEYGKGTTFWFTIPTFEAAERFKENGTLDRRGKTQSPISDDAIQPEAGD